MPSIEDSTDLPETLDEDAVPARPLVVVVDDEPSVLEFVTEVLLDAGYAVEPFADSEKALERLGGEPSPALVVTDVRMPRLDGPSMIRRARGRLPTLPALFISGYPLEWQASGQPTGRLLPKPFLASDLLRTVKLVLQAPPKPG